MQRAKSKPGQDDLDLTLGSMVTGPSSNANIHGINGFALGLQEPSGSLLTLALQLRPLDSSSAFLDTSESVIGRFLDQEAVKVQRDLAFVCTSVGMKLPVSLHTYVNMCMCILQSCMDICAYNRICIDIQM